MEMKTEWDMIWYPVIWPYQQSTKTKVNRTPDAGWQKWVWPNDFGWGLSWVSTRNKPWDEAGGRKGQSPSQWVPNMNSTQITAIENPGPFLPHSSTSQGGWNWHYNKTFNLQWFYVAKPFSSIISFNYHKRQGRLNMIIWTGSCHCRWIWTLSQISRIQTEQKVWEGEPPPKHT